ncbi:APC family permease [Gordonia sp. CPCC 205515]|uniref:APC family permease n=1 Tax=Gordonia sp. CPCC 205515 TaxID=3140791 RepID=UPI003AF3F560
MTTDPAAPTTATPARQEHSLRRGTLGTLGVTFFVISAAAPLTAMAGGAPVAMLLGNGPGVPAAYILTMVTLLVFSVGYTAMSRFHTSTGAFYSYITRGLRQQCGGAAAYLALFSYNCMQIGLWGLFGAATAAFVTDEFGVSIDWWVFALVGIATVAVLGYRQIDMSVKVLSVLVGLEFLVVLILAVVIAVKGGDFGTTSLSITPLTPHALTSGSLPIGLLFCFASFVGFEATAIYSEEAKDPKRTVARATFLSVITIGVVYTVVTFLMVNGAGVGNIPDFIAKLADPTTFLFELSNGYIGPWYTTIMRILFITSVFAAVLAFHNAVARYTYALGREGLLPDHAGRTHTVHQSPHVGSVAQSVLALVVVAVFAITKQDPVLALFTWLCNLGTLGVIALMATSSFAVVAFFARHGDLDPNRLRTFVAPLVAGIALIAVLIVGVANFDLLIGTGGVLVWLLPALLLVAAVLGVIAAAVLRSRSPERYAEMGRHRE